MKDRNLDKGKMAQVSSTDLHLKQRTADISDNAVRHHSKGSQADGQLDVRLSWIRGVTLLRFATSFSYDF